MAASLPKRDVAGSPEDKAGSSQALSGLRDVPERREYGERSARPHGGGRKDGRQPVQRAFEGTATPTDAFEFGELPTSKAPKCV